MAMICPYPGRKCIGCEHRRIDEEYGSYACFVKQDLAAAAPQHGAKMPHPKHTVYVVIDGGSVVDAFSDADVDLVVYDLNTNDDIRSDLNLTIEETKAKPEIKEIEIY